MNSQGHSSVGESWSLILAGASGESKSMMSFLTPAEASTPMQWSRDQPRSATGAIDMMAWPGWKVVMERRAAAAPTKPTAPWFHLKEN